MKFGLVLAAMLVLTGCVAVPPPGPTESEVAAVQEHALQQTWQRTGLPGDPPEVTPGPAIEGDAWGQAVFSCVQQEGFEMTSMEWSPDSGGALMTNNADTVDDPAIQRAFYECVAANPRAFDERDYALTEAQLDYIYDYYQSWLVPCMIMNGFTPSAAPSRVEFHALAGQWYPYYAVDVGLGSVQYEEIERICGAERPQLY